MKSDDDVALLRSLAETGRAIREQVARVVVGQDDVIERMLIGMLAGGHSLLVGAPGLAKTLMIRSLAAAMHLDFRRIQFTPDLMPSDIVGAEVLFEDHAAGERAFRFLPGPIFANVVLADEINRASPKTQSALLEAMQEGQATVGGVTHPLPRPLFVLATQNPIEQEGTYPLPEAQRDRFLFEIRVDYPAAGEEYDIVRRTTEQPPASIEPVVDAADWMAFQALVRRAPIAEELLRAAVDLVRRTRPDQPSAPDDVRRYVAWGGGPRAGQALVLAAKARAALAGRPAAGEDDVRFAAASVLRPRIVLNYHANADGVAVDELVARLLSECDRLSGP